MNEYFIILILQVFYVMVKNINVITILYQGVISNLIISNLANLVWLLSSYLGISSLLLGDYYIIPFYLIGNSIGVLIAYYFKKRISKEI